MRQFFDTTVLVAAVLEEHEHYQRSLAALLSAGKGSSFCAAHNIAEFYATLTRYPGKQRLSPEQGFLAVGGIEKRLTIVALDTGEHLSAIRNFAAMGVTGATIYDGLIAACALKSRAEVLYTWNLRHFHLLGPEVARIVRTP